MNEAELIQRGFTKQPDGSWSKPCNRLVREMASHSAEPIALPPLERGEQEQPRSKKSMVRVSLIACRSRLLGEDSCAYSMKALRDIIARDLLGGTIGQLDDDPRIEWETSQIKTSGAEGVIVKIEVI